MESLSSFEYIRNEWPRSMHLPLEGAAISFTLGVVNFRGLRAVQSDLGIEKPKPSTLSRPFNADTNLQRLAKIYALLNASGRNKEARAVHLFDDDKRRVRRAWRHPVWADANDKVASKWPIWNELELTSRVEVTLTDKPFVLWLNKFARVKFMFLHNHGMSQEDVKAELLSASVNALYKQYPRFISGLHMTNVAKQAAHNHGMNIIHTHTCKSRSHFTPNIGASGNAPSNLLNTVSWEQLVENGVADSELAQVDLGRNFAEACDIRLSLEQILARQCGRSRRFMLLLLGYHDDEFSKWLGEPNETWFAEENKRMQTIARFMGLTNRQMRNAQKNLRNLLS